MQKDHDLTIELLPWYVNDTLSGKEAELVLRHLAECRDCQAERDRLYELQDMIQESDSNPPDYQLSYRRVMKRIETSEKNRQSADEISEVTGQRQRNWFFPVGVAASIFSVMIAGAAWLNLDRPATTEEFQTLSSDVPSQGAAQRLELGFVNPIPAATMRQALIETDSNIVSGPDANGIYVVEVVVPATMTADEYLVHIRQIEGVENARFASN